MQATVRPRGGRGGLGHSSVFSPVLPTPAPRPALPFGRDGVLPRIGAARGCRPLRGSDAAGRDRVFGPPVAAASAGAPTFTTVGPLPHVRTGIRASVCRRLHPRAGAWTGKGCQGAADLPAGDVPILAGSDLRQVRWSGTVRPLPSAFLEGRQSGRGRPGRPGGAHPLHLRAGPALFTLLPLGAAGHRYSG